ncbi:import inner membrane translocase subunit Tim44 [Paenibacillus senegalensis]|uniref:import inner membrane translocase subunit Tim44 n=1 Tax=Paenibacillus senegalensis TaxID=1465766 RepID=UPI000288B7CC|nr:import inner membrane translocase subunit Tim44 [Paenibacillus senegalensis]
MKKFLLVFMSCFLFLAVVTPDLADARRGGGGYKSNTGSFKKQDTSTNRTQYNQSNVSRNDTSNTSNANTRNTAATNQNRGFFSGGSFMKGMMIGGIAGLLFGGLFAGMGFMGEILGLLVNLAAMFVIIFLLFAAVRWIFNKMDRRRMDTNRNNPYKRH